MKTETKFFTFAEPPNEMVLEVEQRFRRLGPVTLAYETYGELSPDKDNTVLVFHALSGSQHAAGYNPHVPGCKFWTDECHTGWWDGFIGPGKALDTDQLFVICANYIGGCYGSTGPLSINPATGKPWMGDFPIVTVSDVVDSQLALLDHLGIKTLLAATGGSMGGMFAMDLAIRFPERVRAVIPIATGGQASMLQKVLNFEQIYAIEEDANFNRGFYAPDAPPHKGLKLARMISHKTFVSLDMMSERSRGHIIQEEDDLKGYRMQFQIESYMLYQGKKFIQRFDANSYLHIICMWHVFDLPGKYGQGSLARAYEPCRGQNWLLFSIDCDTCFYPEMQRDIARALKEAGIDYQHVTVHSEKGHDSFLLEPDRYAPHIRYLLQGMLQHAAQK